MLYRILTIPFDEKEECFCEDELTKFCINKKVNSIKPEFFMQNSRAYWTFYIEYEEILTKEKPEDDIKSEADRIFLDKLKEWRKDKADGGGVPVYIIATNSELKSIVLAKPATLEALRSIRGFGKKKIEKHGKDIIELVKAYYEL